MKYLYILILFVFVGCNPQPKTEGTTATKKNGDFNIKVIDSCEYIEYDYGILDQRVYSLIHKGNCKYCIQRQNLTNHNQKP
jgi:hypothetical protein